MATNATTRAKTTATPKRATTRKANPERPPKPEFVVIEDNLHYSPDGVREIVVSVDPIWEQVEPVITQTGDDVGQGEVFKAVLGILYGEAGAAEKIRGLKTSQFFTLAYRWMDEFSEKMGIESPGE